MKTPMEKKIERYPSELRGRLAGSKQVQLQIKAERKLMREGYELYSYDDLPGEVKGRLGGISPDICAEKQGEWVFAEVLVAGRPKLDKYKEKVDKVILVFPVDSAEGIEVWGERELE